MEKEKRVRALVIERLSIHGWITRSDIREPASGGLQYSITPTNDGTMKMRAIYEILGELGYFPSLAYKRGEFEFLLQLIREYGKPGNEGQATNPRTRLNL